MNTMPVQMIGSPEPSPTREPMGKAELEWQMELLSGFVAVVETRPKGSPTTVSA